MSLIVLALVTVKQLSWSWTVSQQAKASAIVRLKCKPIAVKCNGHQILMKMFAFCAVYDLAIWSSLCPAYSAFYTYSLTEDVHSRFSVHNYGQSDATNHIKTK